MPKSLFMGVRRLAALLITVTLLSVTLFAQGATRLEGTVKDQSGAVIPKAKVVAVDTKTGAKRETTSNELGSYVFAAIPPSTYNVTVEAAGFAKTVANNVEVTVAGVQVQNFALKVGTGGEVVNVE